jgi:hypothetical protein
MDYNHHIDIKIYIQYTLFLKNIHTCHHEKI